jgi:hypothetical protein
MENREYILCAAIKRLEPKSCTPYHNNDICNIELGYRHHDIFQRFPGEVSRKQEDQGFYTSKGRFVEREEAMYIAWKAGQVTNEKAFIGDDNPNNHVQVKEDGHVILYNIKPLYSEDLY